MYLNVDFISGSLTRCLRTPAAAVLARTRGGLGPARAGVGEHALAAQESGVWQRPQHGRVNLSRRHATYAYDLAVNRRHRRRRSACSACRTGRSNASPSGAGAVPPAVPGDAAARTPVLGAMAIVLAANVAFTVAGDQAASAASARAGGDDRHARDRRAGVAFGGLNWAMDDAAGTGDRGQPTGPRDRPGGRSRAAAPDHAARASGPHGAEGVSSAIRDLTSRTRGPRPIYAGLDLEIPAGGRWRSSARTAPARRRWPSCSAASTTRRRA